MTQQRYQDADSYLSCAAAENSFDAAALTANVTPVGTLIKRTNEAGALQARDLAAA